MIDISKLKLADKGREVRYRAKGGDVTEWGQITSWNDRVVFVRYHTRQYDGDPIKLHRSYASQGTDPNDLEFVNARGELECERCYTFRGMVVPDDLLESINAYIEHGRPMGGLLQAVVDNDLNESCARADEKNLPILPAIVAYLYNEAPTDSWGFPGAHDRWVKEHNKKRLENSDVR